MEAVEGCAGFDGAEGLGGLVEASEEKAPMMGKQNRQRVLFCYKVNLDKRVRPNNPLRKVKEAVDFSFVRREVASCYGHKGMYRLTRK